jgi:hypothetical protein
MNIGIVLCDTVVTISTSSARLLVVDFNTNRKDMQWMLQSIHDEIGTDALIETLSEDEIAEIARYYKDELE